MTRIRIAIVLAAVTVMVMVVATGFFSGCARMDINCDGAVNVLDVQLVVNEYLESAEEIRE